ncbi:hypothetical protein H0H92_014539 [Tricholoma furcatifolium]|nr:hypothetical protein H0H92_014539 [Tricholoma furcatifolium]
MFFYISFLRPPPLQSASFGNIQITPQIANDLRTEPFEGSADIFYSWSQTSSLSPSANREVITRPVKLTTWRQATAYKTIPVPLPSGVRDGQSWRLVLGTKLTAGPDGFLSIDLCDQNVGSDVFPVMSMPIKFGPPASKHSSKQERIERMYRIRPKLGDNPGVVLKLTEQTSFDLDKVRAIVYLEDKVWDSGIGLSSWLVGVEQSTISDGPVAKLRDVLFSSEPRNILELGAGIGIVGLSIATLRSTRPIDSQVIKDRIVMTDLGTAIPLIEHNIEGNATHLQNTNLEAAVLDWDEELPNFIKEFSDGFDAIFMADVTYNTASFPSLVRTLSRVTCLGKKSPLVLLGYKERDAAERSLWDLVGDIGLSLQRVGESVGAGGAPVEVWLGVGG